MARTIESAGVEIRETDLSLNATLPVGTNILVQGYASNGPTDELVNITSNTEFEQVYGAPTNAAERYFRHTCKQVLDSPGNLVCTRLPYGLSGGGGYGDNYSALLYPVIGYDGTNLSSEKIAVVGELLDTTTAVVYQSTGTISNLPISGTTVTITVNTSGTDYTFTDDGNGILSATSLSLSSVAGTIDYTTGAWAVDLSATSVTTTTEGMNVGTTISGSYVYQLDNSTTYAAATSYEIGEPTLITLSETEYAAWKSGQLIWNTDGNLAASSVDTAANAGIIIVNELKTNVDDINAGYYVAINDNSNIGDTTFNTVTSIKFEDNTTSTWREIPTTRLEFNLSGTDLNDSMSEDIETFPSYDFSNELYHDSLTISLFRVRSSIYGSQNTVSLDKVLQENHVGSLDASRTIAGANYFLGSIVNEDSNYMKIYINPNIAQNGAWVSSDPAITAPSRQVRRAKASSSAFAIGEQVNPSDVTGKRIGNLPEKLERSLRLAENKEQIPIDLVLDGGLSTIWAASRSPIATTDGNSVGAYQAGKYLYGVFEQEVGASDGYLASQTTGTTCSVQNNWEVIFNLFNTFAGETRRDCLFIADPLRHIFVQGGEENADEVKVMDGFTSDGDPRNFSQHVYWPLKNLNAGTNSNYACTYGNWVKQYDNSLGDFAWLPMSGYEARIMANMDANLQPWYAPAGLNNGVLRDLVDIGVNPTQKQRDLLYRVNVNPVVFFPGDGYVVWGQKTLQKKPSAFDRINVRRLFLVLEKATLAILRYFVFEPNTVFTRTRVVNVLTPIFEIAKNNEGVYDYLIVCDERNNTPQVIDSNELKVDIYLKPVRIAEFILVNFIATRTDQDFNELL